MRIYQIKILEMNQNLKQPNTNNMSFVIFLGKGGVLSLLYFL